MGKKKFFCFRNIVIFILLTPIFLYILWQVAVTYKLNSIKDKLREDGYPVTFMDLANIAAEEDSKVDAIEYIFKAGDIKKWPQEPEDDDYIDSIDELPEFGYMPKDFFNLSEEEEVNLDKFIIANKEQIEALYKAIEIGWYKDKLNWNSGMDIEWGTLKSIKDSTKLLKYLTIDFANKKQINESVNLIAQWQRLLDNSAYNKPYTMLQALVFNGCHKEIDETLYWLIRKHELSNEQLQTLFETIKPVEHFKILPSVFETERVYSFCGLDDYINNARDSLFSDITENEAKFYVYSGLIKLNSIKHYNYLDKYISACKSNEYYQTYKEFRNASLEERELSNNFIYKPLSFSYSFERFIFLFGRCIASKITLKNVIANEIYKNNNGEYADSLKMLKEQNNDLNITDIFTENEQLKYMPIKKNGKIREYFIWSITEKKSDELESVIDQMIAKDLYMPNKVDEDYGMYDVVLYRMKQGKE